MAAGSQRQMPSLLKRPALRMEGGKANLKKDKKGKQAGHLFLMYFREGGALPAEWKEPIRVLGFGAVIF